MTSDRGFECWGKALNDEVMAASLLDRLLHGSHVLNIHGNSYGMRHQTEPSRAVQPTAVRAISAERAQQEEDR